MEKLYLRRFYLPGELAEIRFIRGLQRTCYDSVYPYNLFPYMELDTVKFAPVTILAGSNGCGKTTLLNLIAEKAGVRRLSPFNGSAFFAGFADSCRLEWALSPVESRVLTSDDVFDALLDLRRVNDGIDRRREDLFAEWTERRYAGRRLGSLADYEDWKEDREAVRQSQSRFVRDRLAGNPALRSNGESALRFFVDSIGEDSLYLLDEPENSLSVPAQKELTRFLSDSARHFGCQFIIATHSPVLLSLPDARIYDLDARPAAVRRWTELPSVREYREFFRAHEAEF